MSQAIQDLIREVTGQTQLLKLSMEKGFFVGLIGDLAGFEAIPGGLVNGNLVVGIQKTGAESDRGNMAFTGGAQAENEPQRSGRKIGLIGVRDDGWIEKGSGFE